MARLVFSVLVALLVATAAMATPTTPIEVNTTLMKEYFLTKDNTGNMKVQDYMPTTPILARGRHNRSRMSLGWDYLEISAASYDRSTEENFYYGGFLEGALTMEAIDRVDFDMSRLSSGVTAWIQEQLNWLKKQTEGPNEAPRFFRNAKSILSQMTGLVDGYNHARGANVTLLEMFYVNLGPEVGDIEVAVNLAQGKLRKEEMLPPRRVGEHCSALIKWTHDDLYMAHDTWSGFEGMAYRMYKVYHLGTWTITFSSYAASISSGDDWYQSNAGIAIQETTNEVFNTSLYTAVVPQTVPEFMRVMIATHFTNNGEAWTHDFSLFNSGTYNNQYMVVDFKKFAPGSTIVADTLWIAEQIPGYIHRADVSTVLQEKGYWASYNIPYFFDIFDISGYKKMEEQQGTFWSYTKYARPEIFHRNETMVTDLASMMRMMRYNNYKYDDFSIIPNCTGAANNQCDPMHSSMLAIASRGDLMTVYNTTAENIAHYGPLYGFVAQGCFGAIDTKIASWSNRYNLKSYIINGPTSDQQPIFTWGSAVCPNLPPDSPPTFNFPWVTFAFDVARP